MHAAGFLGGIGIPELVIMAIPIVVIAIIIFVVFRILKHKE
jgi:hypothetical protein